MVKISIVLPIYNRENYLRNTLNSIINQSFKDFEIICINDESTDNSLAIIEEFASRDSRIIIINQENGGAGNARNNGLKNSNGEYVFFMDSDDYIVPSFIEKTITNAKSNESDVVMFKIGTIKNNKKIKSRNIFPIDEYVKDVDYSNYAFSYKSVKNAVLNWAFAPWGKVYKKEFLDRHEDFVFEENLEYEDVLFHVKTLLNAERISFVPEYLYYYRVDTDNSLTSNDEIHFDIIKVVDNVKEYMSENEFIEEFEKEFEFFKVAQITSHITIPVNEEYFSIAKAKLDGIDIYGNDLIFRKLRKKLEMFYGCKTAECYQKNIKVHELKEKHNALKKENRKLKRKNRTLKEKRDELKNTNEKLMSSNSWKLTKPIRNMSNLLK